MKNSQHKKAGIVAQVVEHLASSTPSTIKKKGKGMDKGS
jgi:hypothetical protein